MKFDFHWCITAVSFWPMSRSDPKKSLTPKNPLQTGAQRLSLDLRSFDASRGERSMIASPRGSNPPRHML
jgi:hypothetical protein